MSQPASADAPPRQPLSLSKKLRFTAILFVLFFVGFEGAARVGSYFYHGRNPYYLFYGFRSWSNDEGEGHTDKQDGYFKFPPNQTLLYGTPEPCRINNRGFRGEDFETHKAPGTFRIACMGASSTFGYLNKDEDTYPVKLERILDRPDVEVLNLAIPHFNTSHLAAVLENEILDYEPDLLTLYTGCNDAVRPLAETPIESLCSTLDKTSAAYATTRKAVNALFGPVLFGQWTSYLASMDRAAVQRQLDLHRDETRKNLERIIELARANDVPLVMIRQPITIWFDRESRGLVDQSDPRPTYEEEYASIVEALERDGALPGFDVTLYVHHHLLDVMDELAEANDLPVVDNVALVAERPETLGSKVHLTHEANERLARELAAVIRPMLNDPPTN